MRTFFLEVCGLAAHEDEEASGCELSAELPGSIGAELLTAPPLESQCRSELVDPTELEQGSSELVQGRISEVSRPPVMGNSSKATPAKGLPEEEPTSLLLLPLLLLLLLLDHRLVEVISIELLGKGEARDRPGEDDSAGCSCCCPSRDDELWASLHGSWVSSGSASISSSSSSSVISPSSFSLSTFAEASLAWTSVLQDTYSASESDESRSSGGLAGNATSATAAEEEEVHHCMGCVGLAVTADGFEQDEITDGGGELRSAPRLLLLLAHATDEGDTLLTASSAGAG